MKRLTLLLAPVGFALILVGAVMYGILFTSGWKALAPLCAGLALVAAAAIVSFREASEGSRRSFRHGLSAILATLILGAILIFLQTIAVRHDASVDTTRNQRFSLSMQTRKILDGLDRNIAFTCFFKEAAETKQPLDDLLQEYAGRNRRVSYRFIDPDKDPAAARRYNVKSYGTIVVECDSLQETISEASEEALTNALLMVTRNTRKLICFLSGHGERSITDPGEKGLGALAEALRGERYDVREVFALRDTIPPDCAILVIAGPEKDLFPPERGAIERHLAGGRNALVMIDPLTTLPLVDSILASYGLTVAPSIVIDQFGRLLAGNYLTPVVNQYGKHAITEGFRLASFFPQARSLATVNPPPENVSVFALALAGESAYAETNLAEALQGKTTFESPPDIGGPVTLAAVATRTAGVSPGGATPGSAVRMSRLALFGDSDFATNAYLNLGGNRDLIMNTLSWLAEEEDLISIRPRDSVMQPVILSQRQGSFVFWLPVVVMPVAALAIGVTIVVRRRRSA